MIRTIIIEDEKNARIALRHMIMEDCPEIEIIGEAGQVNNAIAMIEALRPDLIFMDIQLGNQNSFEILKAVKYNEFHLIFTTAYEHYAVKAFRFSAIDYLLKPINREYLRHAVDKLAALHGGNPAFSDRFEVLLENLNQENQSPRKIILSTQEMMRVVALSDIL
ncbi:MAG: response regulator, partial [Bacteroidota bacterium]